MAEASSVDTEQNRFNITPESIDLMQKTKGVFEEIKQDIPYLSGVVFFGSRTKGKENLHSDMDIIIFYDANKINSPTGDITEKLLEVKDRISQVVGIPIGSHVGWEKNLSVEKTDIDIYKYIRFAQTLNNMPREKAVEIIGSNPEAQNLFSRFFLGIGEGLYKNRAYILDQFKGVSEGDLEFGLLMDALATFEADNRIETSNRSEYRRLPKTVEDARNYFLIESKSA